MMRARTAGSTLVFLALSAVTLMAAPARKGATSSATAKSSAPNDSDVVLARVGKETITRRTVAARLADIPDQYRGNYATPEGRRELIDRIIEERVWLQDAERAGIPQRPDVQQQLASQRRDLLIRTWVNEQMASNPAPTDSEAKAYYDAHQADFKVQATVGLRHIEVKTEAEARKVLGLAKAKDADWMKLVSTYSTDTTTRATGGSLGMVTKDGAFVALGPQPAIAESALKVSEGSIIGPFKTAKGWHVMKVDTSKPESIRPFDSVHTFITRTLTTQRQGAYYQEQIQKARARIGVSTDSTTIKDFLSARKTARELFQDAQQAGSPESRIDGYRKVVSEYPDSDIAPQAQFMVGFINSEELKKYDDAEKAFRELLARYPKSELATSAQWMVDHMRTEEAPSFPGVDSLAAGTHAGK